MDIKGEVDMTERQVPDSQLLHFYLNLTRRQREVACLASRGLTNREIAEKLCIAPSVVAGHLTNVYADLVDNILYDLDEKQYSKRYALIRLLTGFFERHPEMDMWRDDST